VRNSAYEFIDLEDFREEIKAAVAGLELAKKYMKSNKIKK